ncbi:MAG: HAMP domain-containing histidine kinase [Chlamydiia bacterium]|nr:HAMP domain-containing histidine kinase [Chlamydiia bacterium]
MEGDSISNPTPTPAPAMGLLSLMEATGVMACAVINIHGEWSSPPDALLRMISKGGEMPKARSLLDLVHPIDQSECAATLANVSESMTPEVRRLRLSFTTREGRRSVGCHLVFAPAESLPAEIRCYFDARIAELNPDDRAVPHMCILVIPKENDTEIGQRGLQEHKLVNLGAISAGIAHDLNNLLTGMGTFTHLLRAEIHDRKLLKYLSTVEKTIEKSSKLTQSITDYLREDQSYAPVVDPVQCLRDIVYIVRRTLRKQITISTCVPTDSHPVGVKRSELNQVYLNLLINARDAIPARGNISVRASFEPFGAAQEFVLSVEDTGEGIPPEREALIFDPFFTTKAQSGGTGLGLTVMYSIVRKAGGSIKVESEPGIRTCFTIRLPLAQPASVGTEGGPEATWVVDE